MDEAIRAWKAEALADFSDYGFEGEVDFSVFVFPGGARFNGASFSGYAGFGSIRSVSAFSLAGTSFHVLPDFIQAHFEEAPRLDNLSNEPGRSPDLAAVKKRFKAAFKGDAGRSARWRALKRLAV